MNWLDRPAPALWLRWEALGLTLATAVCFALVPILLGGVGLSWDAINHHIYLGWTAEHSRFDRDYIAASFQAYQFPYLYWPVYKLAAAGVGGVVAGVVLALLHVPAVPAVFLLARACVPGGTVYHVLMRAMAVALAFASPVFQSMLGATSNDGLAAVPLLWAMAVMVQTPGSLGSLRASTLSGVLTGLACAFKLSNAYVALVMPLLWAAGSGSVRIRLGRVWAGCVASACALLLVYGPWGWQLWTHYGNPIYPLNDAWFEGVRATTGWHP